MGISHAGDAPLTLVAIRKTPRTPDEWKIWHWNHYLDHKFILAVVASKTSETLLMPPIWPIPGNDFSPKIAEFHQILHQQMNAVSGTPSSDMLQVDLSTLAGAENFVRPNFSDHYAFHQLVGVPV